MKYNLAIAALILGSSNLVVNAEGDEVVIVNAGDDEAEVQDGEGEVVDAGDDNVANDEVVDAGDDEVADGGVVDAGEDGEAGDEDATGGDNGEGETGEDEDGGSDLQNILDGLISGGGGISGGNNDPLIPGSARDFLADIAISNASEIIDAASDIHTDKCSNVYMETSSENKVKASSQLNVANALIEKANELLEQINDELPAANQELVDFEASISSEDFRVANEEWQLAIEGAKIPEQQFNTWTDMSEARMEAVQSAYKTWEGYQALVLSKAAIVEKLQAQEVLYETMVEYNPIDSAIELLATTRTYVETAQQEYIISITDQATAESLYENAGVAFQNADRERALAEQRHALAYEAINIAKETVIDLATGDLHDQATQLIIMQNRVAELNEQKEVYVRDASRANLSKVIASQRLEAATTAFEIAVDTCASLGGSTNPADLALKIEEEREQNRELIERLENEEMARDMAIIIGQDNYDCQMLTEWNGMVLTRPVRPLCNSGYCCGQSVSENETIIETCQTIDTQSYMHFPMRAANSISRLPSEILTFSCIEGAKTVAASAAALISTLYMLA